MTETFLGRVLLPDGNAVCGAPEETLARFLDGGLTRAAFDEGEHPRRGKGEHGGGEFTRKQGPAVPSGEIDAALDYEELASRRREWGDREDHMAAAIWKARGYDTAPPRLVSPGEFARLTTTGGWTACYRGVHGTGQAQADGYAAQFKTGRQFAGQGIHGSGTYTTTDPAVADDYAWQGNGAVLKIALAPDAKIISQRDAEAAYEAAKAAAGTAGHPWPAAKAAVLGDPGHYASYLGFDAMSVPRADGSTWYIIQNRAATAVVR